MQITRSGIDTQKGPADCTDDVYIDAVAAPAGTSTFAAALVHFTPGARTANGRGAGSPIATSPPVTTPGVAARSSSDGRREASVGRTVGLRLCATRFPARPRGSD